MLARKVHGHAMRRLPWLILALMVLIGAVAAAWLVALGQYDVAGNTPHTRPVYSLLEVTKQQSVRRQARDVVVPVLQSAALQARGASCYREHCLQCHGAPGFAPEPIGLSMQPLPGSLADATRRWTAGEIYWITRNGIKMTGMPAWQHRLHDDDLWALVAFLNRMSQLSPAQMRETWQAQPALACGERTNDDDGAAPDAARGKLALTQYGCHGCHRIDGIVGPETHVGPPLHDFARRLTLPGARPHTPAQLVQWLRDPQAIDPQTAMPDLGVTARDARDMAAFLATLR
jgi:mono/diheme cytochrome c family protein